MRVDALCSGDSLGNAHDSMMLAVLLGASQGLLSPMQPPSALAESANTPPTASGAFLGLLALPFRYMKGL